MRTALLALALIGCEPMPTSGDIFAPVQVQPTTQQAEDAGEPWFDDTNTFAISSEELLASTEDAAEEPSTVPADPDAADPVDATSAEEAPTPTAQVTAPASTPSVTTPASVAATAPSPMATGWPVRLVRTLPETLPPRAIIGLPDGSETVVSPGTMLPEQGIVVISIGSSSAEIARIAPQGDYAAVQSATLTAQY